MEAWEDQCIAFTLATTNGTEVAEFASWITDPSFAAEAAPFAAPTRAPAQADATATAASDWTVDDASTMFEILFGEAGREVKTRYLAFGGTVVKAETPGLTLRRYVCENFSGWTYGAPRIILDDDIPNAVDAALALYDAISRTDGLLVRYDFKQYVVDDMLDPFANPEDIAKHAAFWQDGYKRLGATIGAAGQLVEAGASIANGPLGFVIDMSYVSENLEDDSYGKALAGALFATTTCRLSSKSGSSWLG